MEPFNLVTVKISPKIAARLKKFSELTDRTQAYLAAEAIEEYLDVHASQLEAIEDKIFTEKRGE